MLKSLLTVVVLCVLASPAPAAQPPCIKAGDPRTNAADGVQISIKSQHSSSLAKAVPIDIAFKNTAGSRLFIRYEPVALRLTFAATDMTGECVERRRTPRSGFGVLTHGFVGPNEQLLVGIDLQDYLLIEHPGAYTIIARFRSVISNPKTKRVEKADLISLPVVLNVVP